MVVFGYIVEDEGEKFLLICLPENVGATFYYPLKAQIKGNHTKYRKMLVI